MTQQIRRPTLLPLSLLWPGRSSARSWQWTGRMELLWRRSGCWQGRRWRWSTRSCRRRRRRQGQVVGLPGGACWWGPKGGRRPSFLLICKKLNDNFLKLCLLSGCCKGAKEEDCDHWQGFISKNFVGHVFDDIWSKIIYCSVFTSWQLSLLGLLCLWQCLIINAYIGKQQYFKSNLFSEPAALGSWDARKGHGQSTGQPRNQVS